MNKRNPEGYNDPTPYEALRSMEQAGLRPVFRPIVYICSPYAGDIAINIQRARQYCRFAVEQGAIPLAMHLLLPQFMDDGDPAERNLALYMNGIVLGKCRELWVFGDTITTGMAREIEKARTKGLMIRHFDKEV